MRLSRSQVDRCIKALAKVGLKTKKARSRFHKFAPVIHYRFDMDVLSEKAESFFADPFAEKPQMRGLRKSNLRLSSKRESEVSNESLYTEIIEETLEENITTTAFATANAGPILSPNEKDVSYPFVEQRLSSPVINGKSESSAQAENRKQGKAKATTPPSPTPSHAAPVAVDDVERFSGKLDAVKGKKGKGKTGFTRVELNAMAETLGDALGVPPVGKDFVTYGNVACDLLKATIPTEEFAAHVKFCKEESGGRYTITVTSLTSGGRPSRYVAQRDKKAIEDRKQKELEEQLYARYPQLRPRETQEPVEYMPADEVQRMMDMVLNSPTRQENAS
jgi:hypothetical protein